MCVRVRAGVCVCVHAHGFAWLASRGEWCVCTAQRRRSLLYEVGG